MNVYAKNTIKPKTSMNPISPQSTKILVFSYSNKMKIYEKSKQFNPICLSPLPADK